MTGAKTNERPGTRAVLRHAHLSAYKAREVLDLIRGEEVGRAREILQFCDREAATVIAKVLASASANVEHNDGIDPGECFVAACYADEGTTLKRFRPRARGRAARIRKRTCHVTVILARLEDADLSRRRERVAAEAAERRARRVAGTRRQAATKTADVVAAPLSRGVASEPAVAQMAEPGVAAETGVAAEPGVVAEPASLDEPASTDEQEDE
jgi:large subunit ribosomal protein L22